jgi:hypothetical protein
MANTVEKKLLLNGDRFAILAVYLRSDGASGELANEVLIDPVDDLGLKLGARLRLNEVTHSFAGFDAVLQFASGGVDPNWKWVLTAATNQPFDFGAFGNLIDDSGMDGNGKLTISTTGFTAAGDQGSILLKVRKP